MALPSGYRELSYIKSSGTQYIDTGFVPNQNTRIDMDIEILSTTAKVSVLFGVRTSDFKAPWFGVVYLETSLRSDYGSAKLNLTPAAMHDRTTLSHNKNVFTFGGVSVTNTASTFTCGNSLFLLAYSNGGTSGNPTSAKLYSCKIYDNGTLVRDYVPAKRTSDSVVGLYDLQNDVFYTNAGTGEFVGVITTGPVDGSGVSIVQATSYGIRAGKTLVDGTAYDIYNGRTLVGGTGYNIAFGIPLSTLPEGTIVYLNENGSPVEFYIAKHDYESGLNGSGRTLLARKNGISGRVWNSSEVNTYASCTLNTWLNGTYKAIFDADIQAEISTTKFYYTPGNGNYKVGTLSKSIFIPSVTELGKSDNYANKEGSTLPIASTLRQLYVDGTRVDQWTRSPYTTVNTTNALYLKTNNYINYGSVTYSNAVRPIFTLPCETLVNPSDYTIIG